MHRLAQVPIIVFDKCFALISSSLICVPMGRAPEALLVIVAVQHLTSYLKFSSERCQPLILGVGIEIFKKATDDTG